LISELHKKNILVTGSNGLLGQKLVHLYKSRVDVKLVACSKGENRISEKNGYIYEQMDITDKENVQQIIQKYKPHVIIHTAAMTNVDACELEKETCYNINVNGTKNLLQAAALIQQHKIHFIHLSTDFIFDGKNGPYKEEDKPNPLSRYAETKLESEKLVEQSSLNWSIVRTIIVFGVAEKMSRTNIVLWAIEALKNGKELTIVNDQFRSPTLAEDLAEACVSIANTNAYGIYHISGKDFMSIYEMVVRIAKYLNLDTNLVKPITSTGLNQPAKRPPKTGFDISKATHNLGYSPHTFEEAINIVVHQIEK
jgi:dTDP-4-dehydrorhamnose reductase